MSKTVGFDYHPCPRCDGHGDVPLAAHLFDVLVWLRGCPLTLVDLARLTKTNVTAMNNRLAALMGHGFVSRERVGKPYLYTLTTHGYNALNSRPGAARGRAGR